MSSYNKLKNFCDNNILKLNPEKTHYLQLTSSQRYGANPGITSINLDGEIVRESIKERVLGVIVSRTLGGWASQVEKVLQGCAGKLSAVENTSEFRRRLQTG